MDHNLLIIISSLVLLIYLVIGLMPSKKDNKETFLISDRNLGGISNGFSIAASKIGAGLLITYSTFFFAYGVSAFFYFIGIIVGYYFFYKFAKKLRAESEENKYYTLADYFTKRYGFSVGRIVGIITTLSVFGWVLTNLVAGGKLLTVLTDIPIFTTTSVLALVIGTYLYFGGFNSVIKTDKIQYLAFLIILIVFSVILYNGIDIIPVVKTDMESIPILKVIGFFILGICFPMGSAELWQRVYASKNDKELKISLNIAGISYVILGVLVSIICIAVMNNVQTSTISDELKLVLGVKSLVASIHPIFSILWVVAFFSAIISSADTFVFTTASSIVQDIIEKGKSNEKTVKYIKNIILVLLVCAIIISVNYSDVRKLTILFVGITLVLSALVFVSRLDRKNILSPKMVSISGIIGVIFVITHFLISNGKSEIITILIGLISSALILSISLIFKKKSNL